LTTDTKLMFISFDGIDGAGKSTQIDLLRERFRQQSQDVVCLRDPGATRLGEAIRELLLHREDISLCLRAEMLLYMAARAQLVDEQVRPALQAGKIVLCDRYLLANVVYQGCAGGLDVEMLWQIGEAAIQGVRPDVTILLDLDAGLAWQRLGTNPDRLEKRGLSYFQAVRQGFLSQLPRASQRTLVVDARGSIESIHLSIRQFLEASPGLP
jgi:dTMP kinase